MKPIKFIFCVVGLFTFWQQAKAQHQCGTTEKQQEYLQNHPEQQQEFESQKLLLENFYNQNHFNALKNANTYVIPVVFHVLHNNGSEFLSEQTLIESIERLNLDFNKRNADTTMVVEEFKSIIGNSKIEFRLARLDPNGNSTDGINYYQTTETNNPSTDYHTGRQWPRDHYLNIYSAAEIGSNILGYTYLPSIVNNSAGIDAIVMNAAFLGFEQRVLSHEVGHWLNLNHTWGWSNTPGQSGNCNSDDGVDDTPNTTGWQNCNLEAVSCGSLDNVQNYMDYAGCRHMFTAGQASRMVGALNASVAGRNNLWQTANLELTGVADLNFADFKSSRNVLCVNETISLTDLSEYGATSWAWNTFGGFPSSSQQRYPNVKYFTSGSYDVDLVATQNGISKSLFRSGYILAIDPGERFLPYSEDFEGISIPSKYWISIDGDDDGNHWEVENTVGLSGSSSAKFDNFSNSATHSEQLISGNVDLSPLTSATITFKVAFAQKSSNNNDMLRLLVSTDCGNSWQIRWARQGNFLSDGKIDNSGPYIPVNADWVEFQVALGSAYLEENFVYKLEFIPDGGNNIYIDDIEITGNYGKVPVLYKPKNGEELYPDHPFVDWKATGPVDFYYYQIDVNQAFNTPNLIDGGSIYQGTDPSLSDTEIELSNLVLGQTYYWRVRSVTFSDSSLWSPTWSFVYTTPPSNVGVKSDINTDAFKIYPNPSSGKIYIETGASQIHQYCNLYNVMGQKIPINIEDINSNLKSLSIPKKGLYFIEIQTNERHHAQKIIIE